MLNSQLLLLNNNKINNNNNNINNNNNFKREVVSDSFQPSNGLAIVSAPNLLQQQQQQLLKLQQQQQQQSKPFKPSVPLGSTDGNVFYGKGQILQTTNLIMDALAQQQQQQQQQQQLQQNQFFNSNQNFLNTQQVQLPLGSPHSFPYPIIPSLSPSTQFGGGSGPISISSDKAIFRQAAAGGGGVNGQRYSGRREDEEGGWSDENQVQYPVLQGEGEAIEDETNLNPGNHLIT
jgi:hypothetical protein